MIDEELSVSNEFTTFVRIQLDHEQKQQLNRFLNLHYLGDVNCNEYDENFKLVAKYPEKETEEFKNAQIPRERNRRVQKCYVESKYGQ